MARFEITASDRSGKVHTYPVDAATEAGVDVWAKQRGLIVQAIKGGNGAPAVPLEYRGAPGPAVATGETPLYANIVTGAKWMDRVGVLCAVVGCIGVAGGLGFIFAIAIEGAAAVMPGLLLLLSGFLFLFVAAVARMGAAAGLAMRDIARNSFKTSAG